MPRVFTRSTPAAGRPEDRVRDARRKDGRPAALGFLFATLFAASGEAPAEKMSRDRKLAYPGRIPSREESAGVPPARRVARPSAVRSHVKESSTRVAFTRRDRRFYYDQLFATRSKKSVALRQPAQDDAPSGAMIPSYVIRNVVLASAERDTSATPPGNLSRT